MDTTAAETPWPRTRTQKKLLGALTVWPPVYIILFMVFIFGSMLVSFGGVGLLGVAGAASTLASTMEPESASVTPDAVTPDAVTPSSVPVDDATT